MTERIDAFLLLAHHRFEIEFGTHLDAEAREFGSGQIEQLGSVQQGFRGNAAYVETGTTEDACSFDAGCFEPELPGADSRSISADPAADDHHVIVRFGKLHRDRLLVVGGDNRVRILFLKSSKQPSSVGAILRVSFDAGDMLCKSHELGVKL